MWNACFDMTVNVAEIKERIIGFLNEKGPSLPIPVAKFSGVNTMLASAILSELLNEKRVKISFLRVGNSPLYYTPGNETRLEVFAETNLHGVEKEAFLKLREKRILEDEHEQPAIRVALRHIKDYAKQVSSEGRVFWKYFLVSNEEFNERLTNPVKTQRDVGQMVWEDIKKEGVKIDAKERIERIAAEIAEKHAELEREKQILLEKALHPSVEIVEVSKPIEQEEPKKEKQIKLKTKKLKPEVENFFNHVKNFLEKSNMTFVESIVLSKKEIVLRVKNEDVQDVLIVAYDKKKIDNKDLLKAYKRSLLLKMPYFILSKGETPKKIKEAVDAHKSLLRIDKL